MTARAAVPTTVAAKAITATGNNCRMPSADAVQAGRQAGREESVLRRERLIFLTKGHTARKVLLQKGIGRNQSLLGSTGSRHHTQRVRGVLKITAGTAGGAHIMIDACLSKPRQHSPQFLLRRNDHGDTSPSQAPPAGLPATLRRTGYIPTSDTTAHRRARLARLARL